MDKTDLFSSEMNKLDLSKRKKIIRDKNRKHAANSRLKKKIKIEQIVIENTLLKDTVKKLKNHIKQLEDESIVHTYLFSNDDLPNIN